MAYREIQNWEHYERAVEAKSSQLKNIGRGEHFVPEPKAASSGQHRQKPLEERRRENLAGRKDNVQHRFVLPVNFSHVLLQARSRGSFNLLQRLR